MAPKAQPRETLTPEYQKLVEKFIPMARHEARKLVKSMSHFFDYETLEAEAFFGLVDAVSRYPSYCVENSYDPKNLDYFQYFITQRTRGHLYDYIRQQNHLTRVEYDRAKEIKARLSENKSIAETANELGLEEKDVRKTLANVRDFPMSLNASEANFGVVGNIIVDGLVEDFDLFTLEDKISQRQLATEQFVLSQIMMNKLSGAFNNLDMLQQIILTLRYFCGTPVKDVSDMMGISSVLINKLQTEALEIIVSSVRTEL